MYLQDQGEYPEGRVMALVNRAVQSSQKHKGHSYVKNWE